MLAGNVGYGGVWREKLERIPVKMYDRLPSRGVTAAGCLPIRKHQHQFSRMPSVAALIKRSIGRGRNSFRTFAEGRRAMKHDKPVSPEMRQQMKACDDMDKQMQMPAATKTR